MIVSNYSLFPIYFLNVFFPSLSGISDDDDNIGNLEYKRCSINLTDIHVYIVTSQKNTKRIKKIKVYCYMVYGRRLEGDRSLNELLIDIHVLLE